MKKAISTARPAESDETGSGPQVGCVEVTKVVRDFVPLIADNNGKSFGALVDGVLEDAALDGQEIQDITLHVEREYWKEFVASKMTNLYTTAVNKHSIVA